MKFPTLTSETFCVNHFKRLPWSVLLMLSRSAAGAPCPLPGCTLTERELAVSPATDRGPVLAGSLHSSRLSICSSGSDWTDGARGHRQSACP